MSSNLSEKSYQKDIYTYLESTGYRRRSTKNYNVHTCLDMELVLEFIQTTQKASWKKFERVNKENKRKRNRKKY